MSDEPTDEPSEEGWFADPTGRNEFRYYNGNQWLDDVGNKGEQTRDRMTPHWWDDLKPVKIGINAIYLNANTPTKSLAAGTLKTTLDGIRGAGTLGSRRS